VKDTQITENDNIKESISTVYSDIILKFKNILAEKGSVSICLTGKDDYLSEKIMEIVLEEHENLPYRHIMGSNDFIHSEKEGQLKVSNIRDLIAFSEFSAETLSHKYIIINRLERANNVSENSLLKLLEEPPNDTVIVTYTGSYYSLLNTVRSRLFRIEIPQRNLPLIPGRTEEWQWIASNNLNFYFDTLTINPEDQKYINDTLRNSDLENSFSDLSVICSGKSPEWTEIYPFKNDTWKELISFFISEKIITAQLNGSQKLLISNYQDAISKNIKRISSTEFYAVFFRLILKKIVRMLLDIALLKNSKNWENRGYTRMNLNLFESKKYVDIIHVKEFIEWCEKVAGMEKMVVNPDLTFRTFDILFNKIFSTEN